MQLYPVNLKENLVAALKSGFNIGYKGPEFQSLAKNLKSAYSHPEVLFDNILVELKAKRVAGPFLVPPLPNFRTSPIGVVPKKDSSKFRTITDLSSPHGISVNDFIPDSESAVHFNHFDEAVKLVAKLGKGALLAKLDVKSAFRICPVRPEDWHLLGFTFEDMYFVDLCLPFGLRSSVNRFSLLADAVLWILKNNYSIENSTNYLDDYFLAGPCQSQECKEQLNLAISVFSKLGIPLAPEKVIGPKNVITYLGIEIDSSKMELRLPAGKTQEIMEILGLFRMKKKCTKRELLSLIGKLSFASKIIPSGRTFLRRLIDLSTTVKSLSHHISLNHEAREDINWWLQFLPTWNGKQKILEKSTTSCPSLNLYTDASGQIGFGVYFDGQWIAKRWPKKFREYSIQWKELFPIYLACFLWRKHFHEKRLLFHCDNLAITNIWSSGSSKCPKIMSLVRKMFFLAAKNNFTVNIKHIAGTNNSLADSLSRFQMSRFRQLAPMAEQQETEIPPEAWQI